MGSQVETALVALSVLAAAPWVIVAGMLLSGRWKLGTVTAAERAKGRAAKAAGAEPAAAGTFPSVPSANASASPAGTL